MDLQKQYKVIKVSHPLRLAGLSDLKIGDILSFSITVYYYSYNIIVYKNNIRVNNISGNRLQNLLEKITLEEIK